MIMLLSTKPYKYDTLKSAYDSMKAQYDSEFTFDVTTDEDNDVVVRVSDNYNNDIGYLEDY
jgi:hypothetical protein